VIFTFEHIIKADYANGHDGFVYDGVPVGLVNADATDFEGPDSNVVIHAYPEDRVVYLAFTLGSQRAQDIDLRKAEFYALNPTEINNGVYLSED
jgi:ABC-type transport system substrate-binding protein